MGKFSFIICAIVLSLCCLYSSTYSTAYGNVDSTNTVTSQNNQVMQGQGYSFSQGGNSYSEGGDSYSEGGASYSEGGDSSSGSVAVSGDSSASSISGSSYSALVFSPSSTSNYKSRTSPVSTNLPYLPSWTHGGWGILQTYFPNGPSSNQSYERVFYPDNEDDMKELKGIITSIPYDGPIEAVGGALNSICAALGGPNAFHHGRGFEISNSIERKRRPDGKPLLVFIDSNISRDVLKESGYIYVGRVSLEGRAERNWDQAYRATIAETIPWDVDLMIISGGMKGITVGSTVSFPSASGAYSQLNYSVSMFGGVSNGISEGKGKAEVSAECYKYQPWAIEKRAIPQSFYDKIHTKPVAKQISNAETAPAKTDVTKTETAKLDSTKTTSIKTDANKQAATPQATSSANNDLDKIRQQPGITISRELYDMAGFGSQQVNNVNIR
jgi:hypothetical protein